MTPENLLQNIPDNLHEEVIEILAQNSNVKIERIISPAHSTPDSKWYNQTSAELVIVLKGEAVILFEDKNECRLKVGDYLNIPAHTVHQVKWTTTESETIWLAVHYQLEFTSNHSP